MLERKGVLCKIAESVLWTSAAGTTSEPSCLSGEFATSTESFTHAPGESAKHVLNVFRLRTVPKS